MQVPISVAGLCLTPSCVTIFQSRLMNEDLHTSCLPSSCQQFSRKPRVQDFSKPIAPADYFQALMLIEQYCGDHLPVSGQL
jgi:hypothetical protein